MLRIHKHLQTMVQKAELQHLHQEKDELHRHLLKQQISMRPTTNLEVTLHITQTNPSQTNMFKEDSFHLKQTIWLHSHNNSHCPKEGSKKNTILNGPRHDRERSAQGRPSGSTDKIPQGPAPTAPTTQAGGPPQAPPVTNPNRDHQDPPECNDTTNGSTRAPANGKGPGATK